MFWYQTFVRSFLIPRITIVPHKSSMPTLPTASPFLAVASNGMYFHLFFLYSFFACFSFCDFDFGGGCSPAHLCFCLLLHSCLFLPVFFFFNPVFFFSYSLYASNHCRQVSIYPPTATSAAAGCQRK